MKNEHAILWPGCPSFCSSAPVLCVCVRALKPWVHGFDGREERREKERERERLLRGVGFGAGIVPWFTCGGGGAPAVAADRCFYAGQGMLPVATHASPLCLPFSCLLPSSPLLLDPSPSNYLTLPVCSGSACSILSLLSGQLLLDHSSRNISRVVSWENFSRIFHTLEQTISWIFPLGNFPDF